MFSKIGVTCFMLLILVAACEKEAEETEASKKAYEETDTMRDAAQEAVDNYYQLVTEQNYRDLGFESQDELKRMQLGVPIPVYFMGFQELQQFRANADPNELITQPDEILYPIEVDGEVRCSQTMTDTNGEWQTASFGQPKLSQAVIRMREQHASNSGYATPDYFAVEVPAMYLIFIGHHEGDNIMLTHVHDNNEHGFTAGETEPAEAVFSKLADAAKEYESPLGDK